MTEEPRLVRGRVWFRSSVDEPWQDLGILARPIDLRPANLSTDWVEIQSADGTVVARVPDLPMPRLNLPSFDEVLRRPSFPEIQEEIQMRMRQQQDSARRMQEAFARMAEILEAMPRMELPQFEVERGGISYERGWIAPGYRNRDSRQGEEVYVYDLLPGARVYVLEDVFTVDRVDMDAPLPTVWLKELPTSPLYFTEDEYIYLANETEDQ